MGDERCKAFGKKGLEIMTAEKGKQEGTGDERGEAQIKRKERKTMETRKGKQEGWNCIGKKQRIETMKGRKGKQEGMSDEGGEAWGKNGEGRRDYVGNKRETRMREQVGEGDEAQGRREGRY